MSTSPGGRILNLFKFPISAAPRPDTDSLPATHGELERMDVKGLSPSTADRSSRGSFERLPTELIDLILAFVDPISLVSLSGTSWALRCHAQNDLLWRKFVLDSVPASTTLTSPSPAKSWRELYASHHPYWFLVRQRFWFSDKTHCGSLIVAEYDPRRGCIEAYRLLARKNTPMLFHPWEHDPSVSVHTYDPEVNLQLDDPVIKMDFQKDRGPRRFGGEYAMRTGRTNGLVSELSLCKPIPKDLQYGSMALWPPRTIPTDHRVRNQSPNKFRSEAHRPQKSSEASDRTFRLRKFMQWTQTLPLHPIHRGLMGEEVVTFSAIPEAFLQATRQKPYQGLWIGDYSPHGHEFLLILQSGQQENLNMSRCSSTGSLPHGITIKGDESEPPSLQNVESDVDENAHSTPSAPEDQNTPSGSIKAIKLTGDINVPRGECTWLAEDIGDDGLIRIAQEDIFKGARVVKSMGHIASQGFKNDRYIPSQLIMVSHDLLAQYWEMFRHVAMYRRVRSIGRQHAS